MFIREFPEARLYKKIFKLIFKTLLPMMFFLPFNILSHLINYRFADGNGKIFVLPFKFRFAEFVPVYPERRLAFYQLNRFFNRLVCSE